MVFEKTLKAIKAAQFNLDDFSGERKPTLDEKVRKVFGMKPHSPLSLEVDDQGVVGLSDMKCVKCGSEDVVENGTNPRTVDLPYSDSETVRLRRYLCNSCGEDFTTPLDGVREKKTTRNG